MKLISAQDGKLVRLQEQEHAGAVTPGIFTGLDALDKLLPQDGLRLGAVHELLHRPDQASPCWLAAHFSYHGRPAHETRTRVDRPYSDESARAERSETSTMKIADASADSLRERREYTPHGRDAHATPKYLVWFDLDHTLYPPALRAMDIDLARLLIIRPANRAEMLWALAECLRCNAVQSVVCAIDELSRVDARKLQLAAEQGGGIGWLLRPQTKHASIYAAATRWLVEPAAGERSLQRWKMQLLHGHGGRVGSAVYLEHRHDRSIHPTTTHLLRATDALVDRPDHAEAGATTLRIA